MSHLTRCLIQLRCSAVRVCEDRDDRDRGALNTLEMVVLALGSIAIAAIALAALRQGVLSRVDQLR